MCIGYDNNLTNAHEHVISKLHPDARGKQILEQLSGPRFFPAFEISRSFLRAKQVGKKGGNFQNPE